MDEIREETNSAEAIRQEIKEKRRTYWRGAITGAASVMAVLLIVLLIGIYSGAVVIGGKGGTGGSQHQMVICFQRMSSISLTIWQTRLMQIIMKMWIRKT